MTASKNIQISTELWQGIDAFDEHGLTAFDDCFGHDDEFFDMVVEQDSSNVASGSKVENFGIEDETESKKRLQTSTPESSKRRKSMCFSELQDFACDTSIASDLNTESASVQSAQLAFMTPIELDQQLDQSMSRLALSMKRSELSRQQVINNPSETVSNPFALSILLRGTSAGSTKRAHARYSGSSQLRSFINHVGSTI